MKQFLLGIPGIEPTTAASIWFAGSIGMAIGFGFYQIAIITAIASVFIPRIPHVRPKKHRISNSSQTVDDAPIDIPLSDGD
jgi:putative Mg2+ transporter-C (MgtC) family protein